MLQVFSIFSRTASSSSSRISASFLAMISLYSSPLTGSFSPSLRPSATFLARSSSRASACFLMTTGSRKTVSAVADLAKITPFRS